MLCASVSLAARAGAGELMGAGSVGGTGRCLESPAALERRGCLGSREGWAGASSPQPTLLGAQGRWEPGGDSVGGVTPGHGAAGRAGSSAGTVGSLLCVQERPHCRKCSKENYY